MSFVCCFELQRLAYDVLVCSANARQGLDNLQCCTILCVYVANKSGAVVTNVLSLCKCQTYYHSYSIRPKLDIIS